MSKKYFGRVRCYNEAWGTFVAVGDLVYCMMEGDDCECPLEYFIIKKRGVRKWYYCYKEPPSYDLSILKTFDNLGDARAYFLFSI